MKEIIKYIADDGTIFEDEDECFEYELNLKIANLKNRIRLFDDKKTELPLSADSLESYYYIAIYDITAIAEVKAICSDELGVFHPWDPLDGRCKEEVGLYKYNKSDETWYNLNAVKEIIQKTLDEIY